MKIYYVEDKNGRYASADGSRRFTKLEGKAAYEFLMSPQGKERRFMKLTNTENDDDEINVEVSSEEMKAFRTYERRQQYVADNEKEKSYIVISLNYIDCESKEQNMKSLIDVDSDVEATVFRQINLEILRSALDALDEDEHALIYALYLQEHPMTESEYAMHIRISQQAVHKRKSAILQKLKKYF